MTTADVESIDVETFADRYTIEIETIVLEGDNIVDVAEWLKATSFSIELYSQHKMGMPGFEYVPKHVVYQRPGGKLFVKFGQKICRAVNDHSLIFIGKGEK